MNHSLYRKNTDILDFHIAILEKKISSFNHFVDHIQQDYCPYIGIYDCLYSRHLHGVHLNDQIITGNETRRRIFQSKSDYSLLEHKNALMYMYFVYGIKYLNIHILSAAIDDH
jgi:hypothetical protein